MSAASDYLADGMDRVEGWLSRMTAVMIAEIAAVQARDGLRGDVCEIGVHHGKLFLLLASAARGDETAVAVDVFGDQHKNVDRSGLGDRAIFERNARRFAPQARLRIIQESSLDLAGAGFAANRFRLFSIDGGHGADTTLNDLRLAEATMVPGGVVFVDDVLSAEWTGVITGLARYLAGGGALVPFALAPNKAMLTTGAKHAAHYQEALLSAFEPARSKAGLEFLGGLVDSYWEHPLWHPAAIDERPALRAEIAALHGRLETVHASTSWRITAPLRAAMRRLRGDQRQP